jgi:hypothetical protein
MQQNQNTTRITTAAFQAKFNSKHECYFFLSVECKAYLPPIDNVTIYWLRQLISGQRVSTLSKCNLVVVEIYH